MANRKACSVLITALVVFTGLRHAFVPAPASKAAPMAAAGGALSMLGAQAAHADKIDDAAKKLSEASYPFLKEIDWTSDVYAPLASSRRLARLLSNDCTSSTVGQWWSQRRQCDKRYPNS